MTREEIIDLYVETGDYNLVQQKSKLPPLRLKILLAKAGVMSIQDKIRYGTKGQKLGGMAEELFQKLVPEATDVNTLYRRNNPDFDFIYGNYTIDIKYSSMYLEKRYKTEEKNHHWSVKCGGNQDAIVAFLERERGKGLDNPYILFIPMSFIGEGQKSLHISESNPYFTDCLVEPEELAPYIKEYAEMFGGEEVG